MFTFLQGIVAGSLGTFALLLVLLGWYVDKQKTITFLIVMGILIYLFSRIENYAS